MNSEVISYVSYILALLVGGICFLLVKHTADEFDRWYDAPRPVARRLPVTALVSVLLVLAVVILL